MNEITRPNSKHIIFIIFGLCIISFEAYPSLISLTSGAEAWIAQLVSSVLFAFIAIILNNISSSTNCYDIVNIYRSAYGKILGTFFLIILFLNAVLVLCESSSVEANTLNNNVLVSTPVWFFLILFIIPAIYSVKKGKNAVIILTILGMALILAANIISILLLTKSMRFNYLPPFMTKDFFPHLLSGIFRFSSLFGFFIFMYPYAEDMTNKEKLNKYIFIAIILIGLIEALSLFQMLTTIGLERQSNIYYPKLIQTQLIDYFGFLENGELYIIFEIVGGWFIKYILVLYSLIFMLEKLNIKSKNLIYIISSIVFVISLYASYNTFRLFYFLKYYMYICFFNLIIFPFLTFIIFYIKNKANKKEI